MKIIMNIWSKKQFLSKHDEAYMYAGDKLLKQPALGLQGVPPWDVNKKTVRQDKIKSTYRANRPTPTKAFWWAKARREKIKDQEFLDNIKRAGGNINLFLGSKSQ